MENWKNIESQCFEQKHRRANRGTASRRGIFELVRETPCRPAGHVGTSIQGENVNARATNATPGNRAGTRQTLGMESSRRESTFNQEPKKTQAKGCQLIGSQLDVERPCNNKRNIRIPPLSPPQHSQETKSQDPTRGNVPTTHLDGKASPELPSKPRAQDTTTRPRSIGVHDRLGRQRDPCDLLNNRRTIDVRTFREDPIRIIEAPSETQTTIHGVNWVEFGTLATLVKGITTPELSEFELDREQRSPLS
uniref:Uncharacterized protein n=1 Tax=Cannabis sativa TaxID=3483 RepID=A0A803QKL9_CANSA